MNQRCLYCYEKLEEGQVGFHPSCATDLFGCVTSPLYPFEAPLSEQFCVEQGSAELRAVVMRMARAALILTIPSSLVRGQDGSLYYLSKPDSSAEGIDALVERLEGCTFDGSVEMIAELVEDFSSISKLDLVTFFEQVIFGWIVGCDSMGLGSFALSRPNAGVCSLAAASDFTPQIAGESVESALEINGRKLPNLRRSDIESAMRYMGLKDRIIRITLEKMVSSKERWFEIIDNSPLCEEVATQLKAKIESRLNIITK